VPLITRTPREAFHTFQDHLNRTLNKVLTDYRLEFTVKHAKQERTFLHFRNDEKQPRAVPLSRPPWHLYLGQQLRAMPEGRGYALHTIQYAYRVQRTHLIQDEAEVRFEYVSREVEPDASYSRHHVQFHRDARSASPDFSLSKLHIPTGRVTIENVIRFLITDLGVPPLIETWDEELRKSEAQFREWTRWDEPE
jgi:hypothetical protein